MIESIRKIEPPDWLMAENLVFDPLKIIEDSLFFPRSDLETIPITLFYENVYSYVYTDYGLFERPSDVFNDYEFIDFKIIHKENISPCAFNAHDISYEEIRDLYPPDYEGENQYFFDLKFHPFMHEEEFKSSFVGTEHYHPFSCEWIIYQNSSGKRFSILYFRAEAISVYFSLYYLNRAAPKIIAIINPDCGPFCWTNFGDEEGFFAQLILGQKYKFEDISVPEYLCLSSDIGYWFSHPYLVHKHFHRHRDILKVYRIKVTSLSSILNG
jgi:hypothetical protein